RDAVRGRRGRRAHSARNVREPAHIAAGIRSGGVVPEHRRAGENCTTAPGADALRRRGGSRGPPGAAAPAAGRVERTGPRRSRRGGIRRRRGRRTGGPSGAERLSQGLGYRLAVSRDHDESGPDVTSSGASCLASPEAGTAPRNSRMSRTDKIATVATTTQAAENTKMALIPTTADTGPARAWP